MRKSVFPLIAGALLLASLSLPAQQPDQVQQVKSFKAKTNRPVGYDYLLFLPKSYDPKSKERPPLMLFLHGAGERGTNVWLVAVHGPPKLVKTNANFPFILVSPQCPANQSWDSEALALLLDEVIKEYSPDPKRIYLTGLSMGGYGTWDLGLSRPERFAAIAPICGGGKFIDILLQRRDKNSPLKTLPVWAFHGGKDTTVPLEESERMVNILKKTGATEVELTVYPEAGHDSWTATYANPKLYEWFLAHQRK